MVELAPSFRMSSLFMSLFFSIDASNMDRMAKYINDSPRRYANCIPKAMYVMDKQRVLLFALCDISTGTELRHDYGGPSSPFRQLTSLFTAGFCCLTMLVGWSLLWIAFLVRLLRRY